MAAGVSQDLSCLPAADVASLAAKVWFACLLLALLAGRDVWWVGLASGKPTTLPPLELPALHTDLPLCDWQSGRVKAHLSSHRTRRHSMGDCEESFDCFL